MGIRAKVSNLTYNKTIRNGGLFSLYSFFNQGIGFILLILLAKYIGPAEYGSLSLYNTVVTFLGYFVGLSTAGYMSVFYFKNDTETFKKSFTAIAIITIVCSSILTILFWLLHNYLPDILKLPMRILYIGLFVSFATVFFRLNLDYLRVVEKITLYGLLSCSFAIINFVLSLYLVIAKNLSWEGRIYAAFICDGLYMTIALIYFIKKRLFKFTLDWSVYKRILIWSIPLIPHLATIWIKQGCDRYIIDYFHNIGDVGLFSFALNLTNIIIMIGTAFNQTNSVSLYKTLSANISNQEKKINLKRNERLISIVYIVATICINIGCLIVVPFFVPRYQSSLPMFLILSIYGLLQCFYFLFCNYLFYYEKTKNLMYITFGTSIIHLLLSLWLTRYSLYLTCGIYIFSQLLITGLVFNLSRRLLKTNLTVNSQII